MNIPPSTEIVVVERLVSEEIPVSDTVVEVEYKLSAGVEMVEVGLVVSSIKLPILVQAEVSEPSLFWAHQ